MALLPVEDALARLLADANPLGIEAAGLMAASGRILARPLTAKFTQPPFDASAMDGYAVRGSDIERLPAALTVIGEAAAGRGFAGTVGAGEAVRIFTGAPVPAGADMIAIQENCSRDNSIVTVREAGHDGTNIRPRGGDFHAGAELLAPGTRLGARQITLAAAMGHGALPVYRKPIVAILASGDELVMPGTTPGANQIVCSNPFGVAAMVEAAGGEPRFLGIAGDTRAALDAHIDQAAGADLLITIGGASVFMMPLIERLSGDVAAPAGFNCAITAVALEANGPRTHYMRATLTRNGDAAPSVRPVRSQDSSLLSPLAAADCLLVRPVGASAVMAGATVEILPLDF